MADFNLRFRRSYEADLKIRVDLGSVLGARRPEQPGTDHAQVEHSRSSSRQKLEDTSTLLISDTVERTLMLENLFFQRFQSELPPSSSSWRSMSPNTFGSGQHEPEHFVWSNCLKSVWNWSEVTTTVIVAAEIAIDEAWWWSPKYVKCNRRTEKNISIFRKPKTPVKLW